MKLIEKESLISKYDCVETFLDYHLTAGNYRNYWAEFALLCIVTWGCSQGGTNVS